MGINSCPLGNVKSRQVMVSGSDHFMNNHEAEMMEAVKNF